MSSPNEFLRWKKIKRLTHIMLALGKSKSDLPFQSKSQGWRYLIEFPHFLSFCPVNSESTGFYSKLQNPRTHLCSTILTYNFTFEDTVHFDLLSSAAKIYSLTRKVIY